MGSAEWSGWEIETACSRQRSATAVGSLQSILAARLPRNSGEFRYVRMALRNAARESSWWDSMSVCSRRCGPCAAMPSDLGPAAGLLDEGGALADEHAHRRLVRQRRRAIRRSCRW